LPEADPADDLALIVDAAREAGEIAQGYFQANPQTWEKPGGAGPVSEGDLAVDRMLREGLTAARPGYGWLSEESEDDPARLAAHRCFIVDPIDGTRAFIAGEDHWAHSIAVAERGQIVAAVVYLPVLGKLYAASRGQGATFNGRPIRTSARDVADGATVLGAKTNFDPALWPGGMPRLTRNFRPSLAYRLALVAEGRFDAMITFRDTWEWDVAAGCLLVEEAGGMFSDRDARLPAFNNARPALRGMVAAGRALHAALRPHFAPQAG